MRIVAPALFVMFLSSSLHSDELRGLLAKYDDVEHAHEYSPYYRSLFAAADSSELGALTANQHDSIATQAAWETVALTVPKAEGQEVYRPDSAKLAWFLGFFEGRNRIAPPEWWREVISDARANRRDNIYPGQQKPQLYHRSGIERVACPADATVTQQNRVVTYRSGEDSIVLPEELFERDDSGELYCNISCTFTKDRCFAAIHEDVGYPHVVACIERQTGKTVWKSEACGCWWGGATGRHRSSVSVVPTDDGRVFVFGAASIGFYAHGFDASNGKTLVRFSNNY